MDITNIILSIAAATSAVVASIIAGLTARRWGPEFEKAKNAQLNSKDEIIRIKTSQIESLKIQIVHYKDLSPPALRESYKKMREQLEEYIESLKIQLKDMQNQIKDKDKINDSLSQKEKRNSKEINNLEKSRNVLKSNYEKLEIKINTLIDIDDNLKSSDDIDFKPSIPEPLRNPWYG